MKNDLFKSRVFYGVLMAIGGGGLLFGSKILPLRIFGGGAAALATLVLANELFPSEETEEDVRTWCCPNCKGCPGFGVCEGSCDMCFEPYDDICMKTPGTAWRTLTTISMIMTTRMRKGKGKRVRTMRTWMRARMTISITQTILKGGDRKCFIS